MDPFNDYLKTIKKSLDGINNYQGNVRVVMGNESCDLDSMISAFALGYLWYLKNPPNTLVVPILNIPAAELCYRTENCYVLEKLGIDPKILVFKDDLNLKELQTKQLLSVSLVDHHVLSENDNFLSASVTEIFDHRPIDLNVAWDKCNVRVRIEQVGSCATIIADEILNCDNQILSNNLILWLQYAIIFDTIAFNREAGRVKELDLKVFKMLSEKLSLRQDFKLIFDELWTAHNDCSHLTPLQLLSKDLKLVEGLPVPGLPMLVKDYLKLPNVLQDMIRFCQEKCSSTMVIVGLHVVQCQGENRVSRDVAVFNPEENETDLVDIIMTKFNGALELKGYDFEFEKTTIDISGFTYLKQNNIKLTRKHILPLIKDAVLQYKSGSSIL